jgi:predicted lipoprotein with Yx(FWY)xxD motif
MSKRAPAVVLLAGLIALTACSSSGSPSSGGGGSSGATGSSGTAGACTGSKPASSAADTVSVWCSASGAILVNGKGFTLYASSADTAKKSACAGACAAVWPPVAASGTPKLGEGLNKSLVGDIVRADGSHQLTYGGHPLYSYQADTGPHLVNGQGLKDMGGTFYVVSADTGQLITKKLSTKQNSGNGPGY